MDKLLQKTIEEFGYTDIESFARDSAIEILEHKLSRYTEEDLKFQKKYKCSFQELKPEEHQSYPYNILEMEDDYMDWESLIHSKNHVEKKIKDLKENRKDSELLINYKEKIEEYFQNVY